MGKESVSQETQLRVIRPITGSRLALIFCVVDKADGIITIHDFPEAQHTEPEFEK